MGPGIGIVFVLIVLGVSMGFGMNQRKKWLASLRAVADRYGLFLEHGGLLQSPKAHGVVDTIPVVIDTFTTSQGESKTTWSRIKAEPPKLPGGLELKPESKSFLGQMFRGIEHLIGDPRFDEKVFVQGPEPVVRALLDQETRDLVVDALESKIKVHENCIEWTRKGRAEEWVLIEALDTVLALSARLSRRGDAKALAAIVRADLPDVAVEALRVMPAGTLRDDLCAEILAARSDRLTLVAARYLPQDAEAAVVRVAQTQRNSNGLRIDALHWLVKHTGTAICARDCLSPPPVAAVALKILAKVDPPVPLPVLEKLGQAVASAPEALRHARRHGPAAEPFLIDMLAHEDPEIAIVAANGLWLVGTPTAVPALREQSTGLFKNSQLKSAALQAIEEIQGRVGSERGALTMVDTGAGELSEVPDDAT